MLIKNYKMGLKYAKYWPYSKKLNSLFIENRIIRSFSFINAIGPFFIFLILIWQYLFSYSIFSIYSISKVVIILIIVLLSHLQAAVWLGKRSRKLLSSDSLDLYNKLHRLALEHNNKFSHEASKHITYMDFAIVLNSLKNSVGEDFWKEI